MKAFARFLLKAAKWTLIALLLFIASLFFREQRIPSSWVVSAVSARVPTNIVFKCESTAFGFRHGVRITGIRLYDRERKNPTEAVVSAESVSVDFVLKRVRIVELRVPRLHDGYYEPGNLERNERVEVTLPKLAPFTLTLVRPNVLGTAPERLKAEVRVSPRRIDISEIHLVWPDLDRHMAIDGFSYVDFGEQRIYGEVRGDARQANIRPLIEVLDIPVSLPYMDAFTGVTEPVKASCTWDVNLVNSDLKLHLGLGVKLGRYNGVPMRTADGAIDLDVYTRGTNLNYVTTVGPIVALDPKGRTLDGTIRVVGTNETPRLEFDAKSSLAFGDLLPIIDCFGEGTLDCVKCDTPPEVSVSGTLVPDASRQAGNNLKGTVSLAKGTILGTPLQDLTLTFAYKGDTVFFENVNSRGKDGGRYSGRAELHLPGLDPDAATFFISSKCRDGSLSELSDALGADFGGKSGVVNGSAELTGPISTNIYPRLNGHGNIRVNDEKISQMRIFMGLTDYLAENVPGIAGLVNQSQCSADYAITNGVLTSDNIYIEGDVFSIKAWGSYDIPKDELDFTVRLQLLRNESFLSKLVRPVTFPFTKLLLEFKVTGSAKDPKWDYISVIDRIL